MERHVKIWVLEAQAKIEDELATRGDGHNSECWPIYSFCGKNADLNIASKALAAQEKSLRETGKY